MNAQIAKQAAHAVSEMLKWKVEYESLGIGSVKIEFPPAPNEPIVAEPPKAGKRKRITTREACERFDVCERTLLRARENGRIEGKKSGRVWMYTVQELRQAGFEERL